MDASNEWWYHWQLRYTLRKKVLSRALKVSSAQRSANPFEMVLGGILPEEP